MFLNNKTDADKSTCHDERSRHHFKNESNKSWTLHLLVGLLLIATSSKYNGSGFSRETAVAIKTSFHHRRNLSHNSSSFQIHLFHVNINPYSVITLFRKHIITCTKDNLIQLMNKKWKIV